MVSGGERALNRNPHQVLVFLLSTYRGDTPRQQIEGKVSLRSETRRCTQHKIQTSSENSVILYVMFGGLHCLMLEYILEVSLSCLIQSGRRVTGILAWYELRVLLGLYPSSSLLYQLVLLVSEYFKRSHKVERYMPRQQSCGFESDKLRSSLQLSNAGF